MQYAVIWLTVANVLYLISYSVRDILWLRILSVSAALCLIPFYALQPTPLEDAILWNLLFIGINAYWIIRLMIERRPVHLTPDEERLKALSFPSLTAQEARDLYALGRWDDLHEGDSLVVHDNTGNESSVILRGFADVAHQGIKIAELGEGQYVGDIAEGAGSLEIDVTARSAIRMMCWPHQQLQKYLAPRPDVALALQRSIGLELSRLLDKAISELSPKVGQEGTVT